VLRVAADLMVDETAAAMERATTRRLVAGLDAYFLFVDKHAAWYGTLLRAGIGRDAFAADIVKKTRVRFIARIRDSLAPLLRDPVDERLLDAGLSAWIGTTETLALDWIDRRDLTRAELVALSVRALHALVPPRRGPARR